MNFHWKYKNRSKLAFRLSPDFLLSINEQYLFGRIPNFNICINWTYKTLIPFIYMSVYFPRCFFIPGLYFRYSYDKNHENLKVEKLKPENYIWND